MTRALRRLLHQMFGCPAGMQCSQYSHDYGYATFCVGCGRRLTPYRWYRPPPPLR